MENTLVKEISTEIKERNAAIEESEFDLDIRVFTLAPTGDTNNPQAAGTVIICTASCGSCSCSCNTCPGVNSCFTCTCFLC